MKRQAERLGIDCWHSGVQIDRRGEGKRGADDEDMKMAGTGRSRVIEPFVVERSPDKKRGSSSSDGSDAYPEAVQHLFFLS